MFSARHRFARLILGCVLMLNAGAVVAVANPPAPAGNSWWERAKSAVTSRTFVENDHRYVRTGASIHNWKLETIEKRLADFGIEIPVQIRGRVSATLNADVPVGALRDGKLYRATGTVTSPELNVAGLVFQNVTAALDYREGVVKLKSLSFQIPQPGQAESGTASGQAELKLIPLADMCGNLNLKRVPLGPFVQIFPDLAGLLNGRATGTFQFCVPARQFESIPAWTANGQLKLEEIQAAGYRVMDVTTQLTLEKGQLRSRDLTAHLDGATITGQADASLAAPFATTAQFELQTGQPQQLLKSFAPDLTTLLSEGTLSGKGKLTAQFQPLKYSLQGNISGKQLRIADRLLDSLSAKYELNSDRLTISAIDIESFGGQARGAAMIPLRPEIPGSLQFHVTHIDLARLAGQTLPVAVTGTAGGDVSVAVPAGTLTQPLKWNATATTTFPSLSLAGVILQDVHSSLALDQGIVSAKSFSGQLGDVKIQGSGQSGVQTPYNFKADLTARSLRLETADPPGELAFGARGQVDLTGSFAGTVQPLRVDGRGNLQLHQLRWRAFRAESIVLKFDSDQDLFRVQDLLVQMGGGEIRGTARIPLSNDKEGRAELQWEQIDLADALQAAGLPLPQAGSRSTGQILATIPSGQLRKPQNWTAEGQAALENFSLAKAHVDQANVKFGLADQELELASLTLKSGSQLVTAKGTLAVNAPYAWSSRVEAKQVELAPLASLVNSPTLTDLTGNVSLTGDLHGELFPWKMLGTGTLSGKNLSWQQLSLPSLALDYRIAPAHLSISNLQAEFLGGEVTGDVKWPLQPHANTKVNVAWKALQLQEFPRRLLPKGFERIPEYAGNVSGHIHGAIPPGQLFHPVEWNAELAVQLANLQLNGQAVGNLQGTASVKDHQLQYAAKGRILHGNIALSGADNLRPDQTDSEQNAGEFQITDLSLKDLASALALAPLKPLSGTFSIHLSYQHSFQTIISHPQGEVTLRELRWNDDLLTPQMSGHLHGSDKRLTIDGLGGVYAKGELQLAASIPVENWRAGRVSLSLRRFSLGDALAPFWSESALLDGSCELQLQGSLSMERIFSGRLIADRVTFKRGPGHAKTLELGSWRTPFTLRIDPRTDEIHCSTSDATGTFALGHVSGKLKVAFRTRLAVSGQLAGNNLDVRQLTRSLGETSSLGSGKIEGTIDFNSSNLQSLADLNASVAAKLRNTQATAVPILGEIQPFISSFLPAAASFNSGELQGRLTKGVFRVERLSLEGNAAHVFADGNITTAGRLDLDVSIDTSPPQQNSYVANLLLQRLLIVAVPPAGLLVEANQFLANRLVQLSVTGTINSPIVNIRPFESLGREAVRFFLTRSL